jgi:hypothetical protein
LCFVVLFERILDNLRILCFNGSISDNGITYNRKNHEFLIVTSDMFLNKLSKMLCDRFGWDMFEIEVEITSKMLQTGATQTHYVVVPICSDKSVNSMFGFARINKINMPELYLNSRHRRRNSFSIELTRFSINFQRTTHASQTVGLSKLGDNANWQVLMQEIVIRNVRNLSWAWHMLYIAEKLVICDCVNCFFFRGVDDKITYHRMSMLKELYIPSTTRELQMTSTTRMLQIPIATLSIVLVP